MERLLEGHTVKGLNMTLIESITLEVADPAAVDAGATVLRPVEKSLWGYGGVVQAPDGAIWKVATSAKKDSGPATRQVDQIVLLLAAADVATSKRFYVDRGLAVGKSFGKYVEFAMPSSPVKLVSTGAAPSPGTPASPPMAPDRHRQRCRALHRP